MGSLRDEKIIYETIDGVVFGHYEGEKAKFIVGGDPLSIAAHMGRQLTILEFTEFLKMAEVSGSEAEFIANDFTSKIRNILKNRK